MNFEMLAFTVITIVLVVVVTVRFLRCRRYRNETVQDERQTQILQYKSWFYALLDIDGVEIDVVKSINRYKAALKNPGKLVFIQISTGAQVGAPRVLNTLKRRNSHAPKAATA